MVLNSSTELRTQNKVGDDVILLKDAGGMRKWLAGESTTSGKLCMEIESVLTVRRYFCKSKVVSFHIKNHYVFKRKF